ncbi:hypothetical protein [Nocardioides conyzicola]|uniref:DUF222 domain-containing protein n=1 Tax=Nocardioides conyzicola TaxID=1651781 RepID=A0ABP8X482_9ACTN
MADTEIEFTVGTGAILPGVSLTFRQRWSARAGDVVAPAAAAAGGLEELDARLASSEELDALTSRAILVAAASGLASKRRLLGRVVAGAVLDDAEIDEATVLTSILERIDAPHVRALEQVRRAEAIVDASGERRQAHPAAEKELHSQVTNAVAGFPSAVIRALIGEGLLSGTVSWGGHSVISGLTDTGEQLLGWLNIEA